MSRYASRLAECPKCRRRSAEVDQHRLHARILVGATAVGSGVLLWMGLGLPVFAALGIPPALYLRTQLAERLAPARGIEFVDS